MSTPTEPDKDEYPTDEAIANAGDIGDVSTCTQSTASTSDTIRIPWHMLDEISIEDQRIQSLNHRHITRPHPMRDASISLDTQK